MKECLEEQGNKHKMGSFKHKNYELITPRNTLFWSFLRVAFHSVSP